MCCITELNLALVDPEVDGLAGFPSRMIISYPVLFNIGPKYPPAFEQAIVLLRGPLVITITRPDDGLSFHPGDR